MEETKNLVFRKRRKRLSGQGTKNIFQIFFRSAKIYIKNFLPLTRAMLFPTLGQIAGIILILAPVYFYRQNILLTMSVEDLQKNVFFLLLGLILMVIPGFTVFVKAFWDYMVVMVSLNTMTAYIIEKNSLDNFKIHNETMKLRTKDYIVLLFILMGIWLILLFAPFLAFLISSIVLSEAVSVILFSLLVVICVLFLIVISIYLCLSFQVFAFEKITPVETVKKSFSMMKNNFWRGIWLGILLFVVTGAIIPAIFQIILGISPIMDYLIIPFESYYKILAETPVVAEIFSKLETYSPNLPREAAVSSIGMIITAFLLPLGSASYTLFYRGIKNGK